MQVAGRQMPLIIAHYTKSTGYEEEVKNLIRSLDKFQLQYSIKCIKSLGTWRKNSNYCVWHICEMLEKYPGRSILRVDADAVFQRFPSLFLQESFRADVAATILDWGRPAPQNRELLGGTLFFANNSMTSELVLRWKDKCIKRPRERNPDLLYETIKEMSDLNFVELPKPYCRIFDIMRDVPNPVIEHFQASRRFRAIVDEKGL